MARKHEISRLIEAGQEFLQKGEFKKAAASFKKLLEMGEDAAARNNLALSYYHSGQLKQALNALQPNLRQNPQSPLCYPYAYSLGVMILLEMGRQSEARSYMDKALQGYGDSSAQLALQREVFDPEGEYLSMMMEAAGLLGDHAMVLDLFQRWARPSSLWKCHHLAATACFNRGDLPSAAYHWGQIRLQSGYFDELSRLAILIAHEGYPLFELEYREMSEEETLEMASHAFTDAQVKTRLGQSGYYKIRLMLMLLDETHFDLDQRQMAATALIVWTGDWGRAYGRMLMGSRDLPMETKGAVAAALMDIGELGDGENMLLNVDGRDTEVIYKTIQVDVSPEQEAIYEEGWQMIDQGQNTGAITLWEEQIRGQGKLYPPILLDLIQLYAREGRMREAEAYYGILHEIGRQKPEEYELDLVMAQTYIAAGREDYDEAQRCMKRFIQIGDEMKEEDRYVERTFRLILGMLDEVFGTDNESGKRKEIENKDLPVNPTILRGLKNMPVIWLDEICIKLGIERLRLRKERENRIAAMLQDPDFLVTVLASLSPDEKALLKSLLDRGGWSLLNVMTRKYGTLDGESYYWPEKGTCTVPGGVWSRGLAMVGKAMVKDRRQKIITIPVELRTVMLYAFRIIELKGRYDGQHEQDGQPEPPEQMEQPGLPLWKENPAGSSKVVALPDKETAGERMEKTGRTEKIGRNDLCPCKSGKKYKHCCGRDV